MEGAVNGKGYKDPPYLRYAQVAVLTTFDLPFQMIGHERLKMY